MRLGVPVAGVITVTAPQELRPAATCPYCRPEDRVGAAVTRGCRAEADGSRQSIPCPAWCPSSPSSPGGSCACARTGAARPPRRPTSSMLPGQARPHRDRAPSHQRPSQVRAVPPNMTSREGPEAQEPEQAQHLPPAPSPPAAGRPCGGRRRWPSSSCWGAPGRRETSGRDAEPPLRTNRSGAGRVQRRAGRVGPARGRPAVGVRPARRRIRRR